MSVVKPIEWETDFPVDETVHVIKGATVYKVEGKWWSAVVLAELFGHKKILFYLWQWRNNRWMRKHKYSVNFRRNWEEIKPVVEILLNEGGFT